MSVINIDKLKNKKISESLFAFIEEMKCVAINEMGIDWDSDKWCVDRVGIKFTKVSEKTKHNEKMNSGFIFFAKAYVIRLC